MRLRVCIFITIVSFFRITVRSQSWTSIRRLCTKKYTCQTPWSAFLRKQGFELERGLSQAQEEKRMFKEAARASGISHLPVLPLPEMSRFLVPALSLWGLVLRNTSTVSRCDFCIIFSPSLLQMEWEKRQLALGKEEEKCLKLRNTCRK